MTRTVRPAAEAAAVLEALRARPDAIPFDDLPGMVPKATEIVLTVANDVDGLDLLRLCSFGDAACRANLLRAALSKKRYPVRIDRFEAACLELLPEHWELTSFKPVEVLAVVAEFRPTPIPHMLTWQKLSSQPLQTGRYWYRAAEAAIATPDWIAAWDAVRFALLGVPLTPELEAEQLAEWNAWKTIDRIQSGRALFADLNAATDVLNLVFAALPSNDHKLRVREDEIELKRGDLHKDGGWVPGTLEITPFALRAKPGQEWPLKLKRNGQRVLAIARTAADIVAVRAAAAPNRPRSRRMTAAAVS
jgi:hypothetical protein